MLREISIGIRNMSAMTAVLAVTVTMANAQAVLDRPDTSVVAEDVELVYNDARVRNALQMIVNNEPQTIEEQIRLTQIPAPPFMEQVRAEYYLAQMQNRGIGDAYIDDEGNVIGLRRGSGDGPLLVVAAHLDTVFPAGTDTKVELRDGRYYAPGISDDGRGLSVLLTVIDALNTNAIPTVGDVMFVGDVGEEGLGDLRGIKAIFRDHPDIDGFISIDGAGFASITVGATGSRRFEFAFKGPGGHSFSAFGMASAIHAMGRAIAKIGDLETPVIPKTTFTVGTVAGGTSVNSIAADAVFALDMRSNDAGELVKLEERTKAAALAAVAEENARWNNGEITVEFRLIGDRPGGNTPADNPMVQVTASSLETLGRELQNLRYSSTDSNVPMSMGIPAITIAGGGRGGGEHSPEEWFSPDHSHLGPQLLLLTTLGLAGIEGVSTPQLKFLPPRQ